MDTGYPHDLRRCILLSIACVAASDRDDWQEMRRLMRERDALYLKLDAHDAAAFIAWGNHKMPPEIEALLLRGPHAYGSGHEPPLRWN